MPDPILEAIERGLREAHSELANAQRKIAALEGTRSHYLGLLQSNYPIYEARIETFEQKKMVQEAESVQISQQRRSKNKQILNFVDNLLSFRSQPTPTSEIYEHLQNAKFQIGGQEPKNTLSAILSTSGHYLSIGRQGWMLKRDDVSVEHFPHIIDASKVLERHVKDTAEFQGASPQRDEAVDTPNKDASTASKTREESFS